MGGWKLEVFRMSCYISLPILCFYVFHKPQYFKDLLLQERQYYFAPEDPQAIAKLNAFKQVKEKETEAKLLAEIEAFKASKK